MQYWRQAFTETLDHNSARVGDEKIIAMVSIGGLKLSKRAPSER